jgi:uncharacterized membrane protein
MKIGKILGCHQIHSRSFTIFHYQFPVCARCSGIYLGNIVSILIIILTDIHLDYTLCIVIMLPMVLEGLYQMFTNYTSNNFKRMITGFMFGIGIIYLFTNALKIIL